jgi:outer membrane protein OmpA-like peptidoglycan-associated protein
MYQQRFFDELTESVPETTAIGVSAAVLKSLKSTGRAELRLSSAYSGEFPADRGKRPNIYDFMQPAQLTRVGAAPVMVPVVVNGASVQLPAIHARGDLAGEASEFLFLDDETNPLTLRFRIGIDAVAPMNEEMIELCHTMQKAAPEMTKALCGKPGASDRESLQVVKISYRCQLPAEPQAPQSASGAAQLEQELANNGKAVIYDIHFSFNSDRIREESQPRLAEIAAVLNKHPDWTLAVAGHTDAVGTADYNLDLSMRRAAAVKRAISERYGIAATRLTTAGYGAGQPRDTNETLQGRARNRRVELIKQ